MPFIIGQQKQFPAVSEPDDIITEEWLECSKGFTVIIENMGSNFSMTKDDMLKNIKKIRDKYETDKEKFKKFADILQDDVDKKKNKDDISATVGGLWLKRGLEYLCEVFSGIVKEHVKSKETGDTSGDNGAVKRACQEAYNMTLKAHHNLIMKGIVKGALLMTPSKETLFSNLTGGEKGKDEELVAEMMVYEKAMRQYVYTVGLLFKKFDCKDVGIKQSLEGAFEQQAAI